MSNTEKINLVGQFTATCYDKDGKLKWTETFPNLVTNIGKSTALGVLLGAQTQTTVWYLGLVENGGVFNASDTAASHSGWTEAYSTYSQANRPTASFGAASASGGGVGAAGTGTIATSATTFSMTGTDTIAGAFLISNNTKNGTTGTLYSAGAFTGGNRAVLNGDTLNVTYTAQC